VNPPSILLDTNVLLAYLYAPHLRHQATVARIQQLQAAGYTLLIAPQCLYELYVVTTRPTDQNGLGLSPNAADQYIQYLVSVFTLLEDSPSTVQEWRSLCQTHQVSGKRAHDVRLIAWMTKHGVLELLTLNPRHFQAFQGTIVVQQV
jgi:predicted nucleic acid-binding protein